MCVVGGISIFLGRPQITQPRREIQSTGEKQGRESEQDEMSDPRCRDVPVNLMSAIDRLLVAET
jgi:hypothetical protein